MFNSQTNLFYFFFILCPMLELTEDISELAYKCPFDNCKANYFNIKHLLHHIENSYHEGYPILKYMECPVLSCNFKYEDDLPVRRKKKISELDGLFSHIETCHKEMYKDCFNISNEIYKQEAFFNRPPLNISSDNLLITSDIEKIFKKISLRSLIIYNTEFGKLLMKMMDNSCLMVNNKDYFVCKVWGCDKEYELKGVYKAHITTHKHSISKVISEATDKVKLNFELILQELRFFDSVFTIEGVSQYLRCEKDFLYPISFKNDIRSTSIPEDKKESEDTKLISLDNFKKIYDESTDEILPIIENIWYKDKVYEENSGKIFPNFRYFNFKESITCGRVLEDQKLIFVGTKQNFVSDILGQFSSACSRIYVLDYELCLQDIIELSYGYVRKILKSADSLLVLFSDGKIRKLKYKNKQNDKKDNYDIIEYESERIIDFENIDDNTLICTDGLVLFKIIDGKIVFKSGYLDSFIVSICIRKQIKKEISYTQSTLDENTSLIQNLKMKTSNNQVCCNTVNGCIYSFDTDLNNRLLLIKNFYSQKIIYCDKEDVIFFTNHMYMSTKMLIIEDTYAKTRTVSDSLSYSFCNTRYGFLFGQFDGILAKIGKASKRTAPNNLFRFVKKGNNLFILDTKTEMDYVNDSQNHSLICEVFEVDRYVYVFLRSGVLFRFYLNK